MTMRNQGEEYHKLHASQLTDQLYLAACRAVTSKCLLDLKITSIVNATLELPTVAYQKQDTIQIAVEDKVGAKLNIYFDLIADKIHQVHLAGGKILIYCRAGQSRSATLCIAYFMKYHDMKYEQAFQFVKARRPIIHPNRGFISQLRGYEEKLQTKPALLSRNNSFKLASRLSFAEASPCEDPPFLDADASWDKPLKPFRPGRTRVVVSLHEPLATVAVSHELVVVDDLGDPGLAKQPNLERSGVGIADPRGVASCGTNPHTIGELADIEPNSRAKRKAAFTKLTKPNDIAVSSLDIPLDFVILSDSKVFKLQTKPEHCSSAIPDLLEAYAVAEEVLPECLGTVAKALISAVRAKTVISRGRECATQLVNCALVWPTACDTQCFTQPGGRAELASAFRGRTFIPTTINSKYSTRAGNKVTPVKLRVGQTAAASSQAPVTVTEAAKPVKVTVKWCTDYKCCPTALPPPPLWENAASRTGGEQATTPGTEKSVKVVRGCNSIAVVTTTAWQAALPAPLLDIPIDYYHKLDFSFAGFDTGQIASKSTAVFLGAESSQFGGNMTVIREFPYYSTVLITSALDMFRAQEEAKLNVKWFKVEAPKTRRPDPVEMIMKQTEQKQEEQRRKFSQLSVKWGTERCLTDDFQIAMALTIRLPSASNAACYKVMPVREHLTDSLPFIWLKTELIGKFYVPHYNPVLISQVVRPILRPVVVCTLPTQLDMTNLYTAPRVVPTSTDRAKKSVHMADCLGVTEVNMPQTKTDFGIEEIPDEIHDIQEIKRVLAEDGEGNKCKIWFDVFKRTLMRKRPTYPKVSRSEFLPTATVSSCILQESLLLLLPTDSFIPQTAAASRHKPPLGVATIRDVKEIEKYTEFTRFVKPTLVPERYTKGLVLTDSYVVVCSQGWCWESYSVFNQAVALPVLERATSTVAFPNRLYTVGEVKVHGLTGDWSHGCNHRQARTAFSVLTVPRPTAQCHLPLRLGVASPLPEYQFVQDVEEQAEEEFHKTVAICRATQMRIDSFWFFAMETATAPEHHSNKLSPPQGAATYQLFLPDSEMASKIGQETMFPEDPSCPASITEALSVVNPEALVAEVMQEIKEAKPSTARVAPETRVTRRGSNRVVSFRPEDKDDPKKQIKTIYYGRDRSKSRNRLKDVPKDLPKQRGATVQQQREAASASRLAQRSESLREPDLGARRRRDNRPSQFNEEKIIANLESSVNEANEILTRRRGREAERELYSPIQERREVATLPSSPYTDYRSPRLQTRSEDRHARRSRDTALNQRETERYERNRRMMAEAQEAAMSPPSREPEPNQPAPSGDQTPNSSLGRARAELGTGATGFLSGISGFFVGKSRREQSKDRSRAHLRKARNFM